ncbi:Hypothetical predicted protein [Xyrichtys novacula]|uniref:Uncharacterized protein n=1 Tax=Xyrichtys novacula TaxID=13765 RepID=A0AAV1F958_XYRNO|nr:Hypothetical predicted protein [Xyrichtys novacula]
MKTPLAQSQQGEVEKVPEAGHHKQDRKVSARGHGRGRNRERGQQRDQGLYDVALGDLTHVESIKLRDWQMIRPGLED